MKDLAQLIPVPALSDNYIWMIRKGRHAVVVDPGVAHPVEQILDTHDLSLDAILLTHHHGDHVGGAKELQDAHGAPVYGPAAERLPVCDHQLEDGDHIVLEKTGLRFRILDVPGHTAGHIAYFGEIEAGRPAVFCGDTLFAAGCGRLFEGSPAQMAASLAALAALPPETLVCCGHEYTVSNMRWALQIEPNNSKLREQYEKALQLRSQGLPTLPSTISTERLTNPFLRTSQDTVQAAAQAHCGRPLDSAVAVFACLREWKNNFT